ncbi:DNA polymerase [Sphingomonas palmae]|uniref:DNA polymerase n=1 Tax=Sphingomonas palmae TaxID=1855283 RepID=A0A1H7FTM1_9SPHN|nr:uracil-DNA glycosylase family protein [Sphingomonas palmae]SEK28567.1 DNA polymerase [Sphingomonas palmae]
MGADQHIDWSGENWTELAASTLDWWRNAGVDVVVGDEPVNWLKQNNLPPADLASATHADPVGRLSSSVAAPSAAMPATLAEFVTWRAGKDAPDAAWSGEPIDATGPADAALMVLVDCPERGDRDQLLGGETGKLFDNMLRAIGLTRGDVLLASVCVRRPTIGRVPRDLEQRLGEVTRHHLSLAAPANLLVLGDAATRAVLSTNVASARERLHAFNHKDGTSTRVVASHHPRVLLDRPACKAEAWKDLILLNEGLRK